MRRPESHKSPPADPMPKPRPIPAPVAWPLALANYRAGVHPTHHHRASMGETALHWAAFCGLVGEVQALLPVGADPNATDDGGNTPLHRAADWGNSARGRVLLVMLLAAGADPGRKNKRGVLADRFPVDFPD